MIKKILTFKWILQNIVIETRSVLEYNFFFHLIFNITPVNDQNSESLYCL